jgi:hypothetical protein
MEKHEAVNLRWKELVNKKIGHWYNNAKCFKQSLFIKKNYLKYKMYIPFYFFGDNELWKKRGWFHLELKI